jgi:hypothetical protein
MAQRRGVVAVVLALTALSPASLTGALAETAPEAPREPAHVQAYNRLVTIINSGFEEGVKAFNQRRYEAACSALDRAHGSAEALVALAARDPYGSEARSRASEALKEARRLRDRACRRARGSL